MIGDGRDNRAHAAAVRSQCPGAVVTDPRVVPVTLLTLRWSAATGHCPNGVAAAGVYGRAWSPLRISGT